MTKEQIKLLGKVLHKFNVGLRVSGSESEPNSCSGCCFNLPLCPKFDDGRLICKVADEEANGHNYAYFYKF